MLADAALIGRAPTPEEHGEAVRRLIVWFWHDFAHLVTALARDQLFWAYGQTEVLRRTCVSLARLRHDAADIEAATDPYFKLDLVIAPTELAALRATACSMDGSSMRSAACRLLALEPGVRALPPGRPRLLGTKDRVARYSLQQTGF